MPNKSKIKGSNFERKCVELARSQGLSAKRIPLSGAVADYPEDLEIEGLLYQCKKRKKLPAWLSMNSSVGVIIEQDYCEPMILLKFDRYLELLKVWKLGWK